MQAWEQCFGQLARLRKIQCQRSTELEHLISRAVLKALSAHPQKPRILTVEGPALGLDGSASATPLPTAEKALSAAVQGAGLKASVDAFQRSLIVDCLERHQGRWAEVARDLAVDRANLNRLAKRLGIR
ncbi:Sigma-54 dependent transcriptional regulator [Pseudomonas savastanoi pv. glycinea]|nr:Anaerobic nitric oxide reductase transcription regulator [Pseudomonas savastanoi pv. glycinea]RMU76348.1 Sigma-54 dependent transcriptional regulator [Pseudomonas savastanoi pv. glycinea]